MLEVHFMKAVQTQKMAESTSEETSSWASIGLFRISGIMFSLSVVWRIIDQFVLSLRSTWLNILPSKLFPFLILLGFFWKYRPQEIASVLGLSHDRLRAQLAIGLLIGAIFTIGIDFGGTIVYALFLDSTYPLELHILNADLLWYTFFFFLTNAFLEETLFRGLLINTFKIKMSSMTAILLSAFIFGIWHAGWPIINGGADVLGQVASMIFFTMVLGLLFGIYYERFSSASSLIGPITVHTIVNFFSENFKLGPEPVIQGPDLIFSSTGLMTTTLLIFFLVFIPLGLFLWKFRIERISGLWQGLAGRGRARTFAEDDESPCKECEE
jgi:membrane protease YdiL (CAAX protease family)